MKTLRNRDGLALPMAVLLIGFMTAAVVAAFARVEGEGRTVEDQAVETEAFALAQAGLERALAEGQPKPRDTTYTFPGGSARVRRILVRAPASPKDTSVWLFRSTGRITRGARPPSTRDVAQWVYRAGGEVQVLSSWTSLSGLDKAGVAGDIAGQDECGEAGTLAGVAVPDGGFTGHTAAISGNPPIDTMGTQAQMASQIKIDWVNIANPTAPSITPEFVYCTPGEYGYDAAWGTCSGWPPAAKWTDPEFWPVVVINGSSALPSDGRGTLIVTGDLTFGGGDRWDGIILVGGRIKDNGSGDISGAVITGLNILKGEPVPQSSKAEGTKDYTYNSCEVAKAASNFSRIIPMRNAWMDSWPGWL